MFVTPEVSVQLLNGGGICVFMLGAGKQFAHTKSHPAVGEPLS